MCVLRSKSISLLVFSSIFLLIYPSHGHGDAPKVLLISFDGFRYDHIERFNLENFRKMGEEGVRAERMRASYITKTFPNHATLVTGLYEESHGIIANKIGDPVSHQVVWTGCSTYGEDYPDCGKRYNGEPIWATNGHSSHQHRQSAAYYYPGSNVPWGNSPSHPPPDIHMDFPSSGKLRPFIDTSREVIGWFKKFTNLNLALIYHNEPDSSSHEYGPIESHTEKVLRSLDRDLGVMWEELEAAGLEDDLNVVVLSDHGFSNVTQWVTLEECLKETSGSDLIGDLDMVDNTPLLDIWVNQTQVLTNASRMAKIQRLFAALQESTVDGCTGVNMYTKHDVDGVPVIPDQYHYRRNILIPDVLLEAPLGTLLEVKKNPKWKQHGSHGWNNSYLEMDAIFLARGPAFKKGYKAPPFDNINVYELLCKVLDLKPAPNNGSLDEVQGMLSSEVDEDERDSITVVTVLLASVLCSTVAGIFLFVTCKQRRSHLQSMANLAPTLRTTESGKANGTYSGVQNEGTSLLKEDDDGGSSVEEF